jgi:hypothetical protein
MAIAIDDRRRIARRDDGAVAPNCLGSSRISNAGQVVSPLNSRLTFSNNTHV